MPDLPDPPPSGPERLWPDHLWDEAFVVELRLLGVTGDRIGAALAEAETHCTDSGESRFAAFGVPATYARDLALPRTAIKGPDALTVTATLSSWIGVAVWMRTTVNWQDGERQIDITLGHLVALAVLCAFGALLVWQRARAEDAVVRRPVLVPVVTVGVLAGSLTLISGSLTREVLTVGWPLAAGIGTALLVAGLTHALLTTPREDPVTAPRESPRGGQTGPTRGDRLLRSVTPWAPIAVAATIAALGVWG